MREAVINKQPMFCGIDVCKILGTRTDTISVILDEDEFIGPRDPNSIVVTDTTGRKQKTYWITEAGLYSLILRSRKPQAKLFKRWVTHEVLPIIRATGIYAPKDMTLEELETKNELLKRYREQNEKLQRSNLELSDENSYLKEVAAALEQCVDTDGLVVLTDAAYTLGIKRNAFFEKLRALGMLCKTRKVRGGFVNRPITKYLNMGYFKTKLTPWGPQTFMTQFGVMELARAIQVGRVGFRSEQRLAVS